MTCSAQIQACSESRRSCRSSALALHPASESTTAPLRIWQLFASLDQYETNGHPLLGRAVLPVANDQLACIDQSGIAQTSRSESRRFPVLLGPATRRRRRNYGGG